MVFCGLAAGCAAGGTAPAVNPEQEVAEVQMKIKMPERGDLTHAVAAARRDLAGRTGLAESELAVHTAEAVTWRDGSLGCPEPGMMYTQALVEGYLIRFEAGGERYEYHGVWGAAPAYCPADRARLPYRSDDPAR